MASEGIERKIDVTQMRNLEPIGTYTHVMPFIGIW